MIKVSVMYPDTPGARFDHAYYRDKHMPLVKARMGEHCQYYTIDQAWAEAHRVRGPPTSVWVTCFVILWKRFRSASIRTPEKSWETLRTTPTLRR